MDFLQDWWRGSMFVHRREEPLMRIDVNESLYTEHKLRKSIFEIWNNVLLIRKSDDFGTIWTSTNFSLWVIDVCVSKFCCDSINTSFSGFQSNGGWLQQTASVLSWFKTFYICGQYSRMVLWLATFPLYRNFYFPGWRKSFSYLKLNSLVTWAHV